MSAQAKGEPAVIVPARIQMPKAMIPTEIRNENAASRMTSHSNIRKNRQRIPPAVRVGDRACISRVVTVCPDAHQKGSTWCSLIMLADRDPEPVRCQRQRLKTPQCMPPARRSSPMIKLHPVLRAIQASALRRSSFSADED